MGKYKYHINNLDCANCAREIEEMLNKNYEVWKQIYEDFYKIPLEYTCNKK